MNLEEENGEGWKGLEGKIWKWIGLKYFICILKFSNNTTISIRIH